MRDEYCYPDFKLETKTKWWSEHNLRSRLGQFELKIPKHVGSNSLTVMDTKETLRKLVGVWRSMAYSPGDVGPGPASLRSGCSDLQRV